MRKQAGVGKLFLLLGLLLSLVLAATGRAGQKQAKERECISFKRYIKVKVKRSRTCINCQTCRPRGLQVSIRNIYKKTLTCEVCASQAGRALRHTCVRISLQPGHSYQCPTIWCEGNGVVYEAVEYRQAEKEEYLLSCLEKTLDQW